MTSPSRKLSPASMRLLNDVAQCILDIGYAVRPTSLHVPHVKRAVRLAQLQEASARFKREHGCPPRMWQLAVMCGVSRATVSRTMRGLDTCGIMSLHSLRERDND